MAIPRKILPTSKTHLSNDAAQIRPPMVKIMLAPTMIRLRPNLSEAAPPTREPIPAIPKRVWNDHADAYLV